MIWAVAYALVGATICFLAGRGRPTDEPERHLWTLWKVMLAWPLYVPAFIFALGQKAAPRQVETPKPAKARAMVAPTAPSADAVSALRNLGFAPKSANEAVRLAEAELAGRGDLNAVVRLALKKAAPPQHVGHA